jgi:hypothetical protein
MAFRGPRVKLLPISVFEAIPLGADLSLASGLVSRTLSFTDPLGAIPRG